LWELLAVDYVVGEWDELERREVLTDLEAGAVELQVAKTLTESFEMADLAEADD
jgi:hypothetical protein